MKISIFIPFIAALLPTGGPAAGLFPFVLPADAPTAGVTDLSFLNASPAADPVRVQDGHFTAGGQRVRFWGAILIGADCFPQKEFAPGLAKRLASRGFNYVRMHLFDGYYAPQGIFDPDHPGELRILGSQLDRLDYLISELKKVGIYVELPVHGWHWRNLQAAAQYPGVDLQKLAAFSSGVPLWQEAFVQGEQQFARDFLAHVNPYTGQPYTAEPAVAAIEIINENGIICAWRGGYLRKAWPAELVNDLQAHWNRFLKHRYPATANLRAAWSDGELQADPAELIRDGGFAAGLKEWHLQVQKPSSAVIEVVPGGGPGGVPCAVLTSDRAAEPMAFVDLFQTDLTIRQGRPYRLRFAVKADQPARLNAVISLARPPWNNVGLAAYVSAGPEWRDVELNFVGTQDETAAKLMLLSPEGKSRFSLAGFTLKQTDITGLPGAETLEAGNVALPLTAEDCVRRTRPFAADFARFLFDTDRRYFETMRRYLKEELGCRAPVKGTQVDQYSSYATQAACDFVDSHGYYQHPHFPGKPWDPKDWTVANTPMVNRGGETVVELAGRRVRGKPYVISEYCHPAPSTYCAEQIPTVAAFGALQDWDGIVFHSWRELIFDWKRREIGNLAPDRIDSFFNIARHPVKLVTIPFGTLAFRRGDVAAARQETVLGFAPGAEEGWLMDPARHAQSWRPFEVAERSGMTWRDAFTHRFSLALGTLQPPPFQAAERREIRSDTGELAYDFRQESAAVITVNAPKAKAVIGFGAGKSYRLGDLLLEPGPTRQQGFSVITASVIRGEGFRSPGASILVTATGYVENHGMGWNENHTSVGDHWGEGPVMCEGIPFAMVLPSGKVQAWALDCQGRRATPVPATAAPGGTRLVLGPEFKTLWYELAVE